MNTAAVIGIAIGGGVVAIATAMLHVTAVTSRAGRLEALHREAAAIRVRIHDAEDLADRVAILQQQIARHVTSATMEDEVANLLHRLTQDLNDLALRDRSLTTGRTATAENVQQIPLNLKFRGSLAATFDLLSRLDGYSRIVRVTRLHISREGQAAGDDLSIATQLETFALIREEAPQ